MTRKHFISNSIFWAAAIIASAIVGAPHFLSTVILPVLAASALLALSLSTETPRAAQKDTVRKK